MNENCKIQATYEKWWLNQHIDYQPQTINGLPVVGEIIEIEYIGNTVYGTVALTLDNGCKYYVSTTSFRPRKQDLIVMGKVIYRDRSFIGTSSDYSDRLFQNDTKNYNRCCEEIWNNTGHHFNERKPADIERFLRLYHKDETIKLSAIIEDKDKSTKRTFWIFFYKTSKNEKK